MKKHYSHRERLETILSGEVPDRPAVALWRHFPVDDQTANGLANATSLFQRTYDFDIIKISPSSSYCITDWGVIDSWRGSMEGTRDYTHFPIVKPEDWYKLKPLNPNNGSLGELLECTRHLAAEHQTDTPLIQTIFSPLSQAKNLVGKDNLAAHIRQFPEAVMFGLEQIAESTIRFIQELLKIKIDGLFYAVQHAQFGVLSEQEFLTFGKSIDLKVLELSEYFWLNMLHLHGSNIMFNTMLDYPLQVINWHDRHTPPTILESQSMYDGVVCGGLRQWETMALGTPHQVKTEAREIFEITGTRNFILGTGCVVPVISPHGNILAAREVVDE